MTEEPNQNGESKPKIIDDLAFLLDSSYPLLQRFRESCPGTFKHSQTLMGMVEGVSADLNLDVVFMKVSALYHDIGKIMNPNYFSENQLDDEDPHEKLDAYISYQIISRHVSDTSMILLNDINFPRKLINIVSQHHGTSVIKYFFKKSESEVDDHFRYKSEKPKCVESAIIMICDCIESISRSKIQSEGKDFNPKITIENTINNLLGDSQLDEVVMRLGDLQKIKNSLARELQGTYQKRVNYDKQKKNNL